MTTSYADIVKNIKSAVPEAAATPDHAEAKLRELVAPLWDEYLRSNRINLNFQSRNERQFANGRADTVFNQLIVEYKKPGAIRGNNEKNRKLIDQVKHYIEDLAKEERWKEKRLLGVVFDGNYFLFVRKVGRWIEEEPIPVSVESVERFLLTLEKLTTKAALVPDNLIRDFAVGAGSLNYIASNTIKAFYFALTKNVDRKVEAFFKQWALQFAEVHGAIENKKFDAETLFKSYGLKKDEQKDFDFLAFFFALDTYYGLLMKLLAYQVVGFYTLKNVAGLPLSDWEKLDSAVLKEKLTELEEGGIFRSLGIRNFLEGDLLSWYLNDWNDPIEKAIRGIVERLNQYDPETMELVPDETRDILKKLYQFLVPKQIRHDLGEFYTADWLAERTLNQVGYGVKEKDLLKKRLLDPGCGSGTFDILAIKRAKEHARIYGISPAETLDLITKNIVGFDLNPLAVISARTNYLLAIADLLKYKKGEITIPIYLCDSINPPSAKHQDDLFDQEAGHYQISTSVGLFRFPEALVQRALIQKVTVLLEDGVKKKQTTKQFLDRVHAELQPKADAPLAQKTEPKDIKKFDLVLGETYEKLVELEAKGINGIWARIIKNAFAPLFVGQFDFIVGNPPWVNWEDLPQSYRDQTKVLWQNYGLFSLSGQEARLGGGKKDISMLMMYVAIDKYLKDKSKLCFVITQTLFKTQGAGDGFRRFRLGATGSFFKVEQLDDMVELQPFEGATNRTALVLTTKGEKTKYPLPYLLWKKKVKGKIELDYTFKEASEATVRYNLKAQPVGDSDTSPWMSAKPKALAAIRSVIGQAEYRAYEGANSGGANGIYWVQIIGKNGNLLEIENLNEIGKKEIRSVRVEIEQDLVYPLLRGRDVERWKALPSAWQIVAQDPKTRKGYETKWMDKNCPKTKEYFLGFEKELRARSAFKKYQEDSALWSQYNVGPYTFAPFKMVWKEQSSELQCAVVSSHDGKVTVPDHKLMLVAFDDETDAHYVCGTLNSTPARFVVASYAISIQLGPHLLENIKIPKYDPKNEIHKELARLSKQCHEKVAAGISVSDLEDQIDELAAELWGLSKEELKEIKDSLEEMR
jgi:SAM-dependent methyltransferase